MLVLFLSILFANVSLISFVYKNSWLCAYIPTITYFLVSIAAWRRIVPCPWIPCTSQYWLQRLPQLYWWMFTARDAIPLWSTSKCWNWILDNNIRKPVPYRVWNAASWQRCFRCCGNEPWREGKIDIKSNCLNHYTPAKRIFSRIYWNQPIRPLSVCVQNILSVKSLAGVLNYI